MKKHFPMIRALTFLQKLVLGIIAMNIVIVSIISALNYSWHVKQVTAQTIQETQQIIDQLGINIDTYLDELYRLTLTPYYSDAVMNDLVSSKAGSPISLKQTREIEDYLASTMILPRSEILRVYIFTDHHYFSYIRTPYDMEDLQNYKNASWYQTSLTTSRPILLPAHAEHAYGQKMTQIISVVRRLRDKNNNASTVAVIKVDANYSGIKSICDNVKLGDQGALYIYNDKHDIVYQKSDFQEPSLADHLQIPLSYGNTTLSFKGKQYLVNVATLNDSGLKIVALTSYRKMLTEAEKNISRTILLVLLCLAVFSAVLSVFIRKFFSPLSDIMVSMKAVEKGDLTMQVPVRKQDEIGQLALSFNNMTSNLKTSIDRNSELMKKVYETQYLHKLSQYNALCSQIKPHFLYNTLNTVSLLIKCGDGLHAVEMIENLSHFLRGVINISRDIPLRTELSLVSAYLDIQKIRFEERLTYSIEVREEDMDILIPALSIQPIAENSVKHCCESSMSPIHIRIFSLREENLLKICVTDNGCGIKAEILDEINRTLRENNGSEEQPETDSEFSLSESIGIINVHKRIQLKYGVHSGLRIISDKPDGTTVVLTFET